IKSHFPISKPDTPSRDGEDGPLVKFPSTSRPVLSKAGRLATGPVVDKFFALGYLAGFFGILYLGIHLWMMLNGVIAVRPSYAVMKSLHAHLQVYSFLGVFICGFVFQAAPKLFEAGKTTSRWCLVVPGLFLAGSMLHLHPTFSSLGRAVTAAGVTLTVVLLAPALRSRAVDPLRFIASVSLTGAFIGAFLDLTDPLAALVAIWWGWGGLILIGSQQFISGLLQGKKLRGPAGWSTAGAYTISCAALAWAYFGPARWGLAGDIFAISATATLLLFIATTAMSRPVATAMRSPYGMLFTLAFAWALCGSGMLCISERYTDLALHAWTLGWATTLLLPITVRIILFLAELPQPSGATMLTLVLVWQFVPLGRSVAHFFSPEMSVVVAVAATAAYVLWGVLLWRGILAVTKRQFRPPM
ncbi:MAG: NnrS family protein, partial [Bdellovibrionales bacterium]|nr:NnrS family protein [Bdellovibrionales bacterium]